MPKHSPAVDKGLSDLARRGRAVHDGRVIRSVPVARVNQASLFEAESQPDMFGPATPPAYRPNPDKVRARLHKILAEARACQTLSWEPSTLSLYRTIFPQMALFLPEEEGTQLRLAFEAELTRLERNPEKCER